jgi:predicted MFS family arabinose efflux permease
VSTAPLGALAGGWIAEHLGLRIAMLSAGVGALLLAPLVTRYSPLAAMREMPRPQEPAIAESAAEDMGGD